MSLVITKLLPSIGPIRLNDASGTVNCVLIDTSLKNVIPDPSENSCITLKEASLPLPPPPPPPTNPPDEKICPFTDKSPIITKLPSIGAIVLKEASGAISRVLIETSFKKVVPEFKLNSPMTLNEPSFPLFLPPPVIGIIGVEA